MDDMALLREYATRNSEAAFETLVSRRVSFVYSAALRQVRDPHLAEEITQAVFIILAQKSEKLAGSWLWRPRHREEKRRGVAATSLIGWLFKTTRFAALAQMRAAAKRQRREQEAQMQSELQSTAPDLFWEQMSPLLDEALATLGETDRQAVLLRFFENKSLAEVSSHLGTGEDTARKRVSRALEKLHRYFNKRGVSSTTAIIAGAISANSIQVAPAVLVKSVTAVAMAKGAVASSSTLILVKGALNFMAWTKMKMAVVVSVGLLLAAGTTTVVVKRMSESGVDDSYFDIYSPTWSDKYNNDEVPPILLIRPTHFSMRGGGTVGRFGKSNRLIIMGGNMSFDTMFSAAYGISAQRINLPTNLPTERFDYLVTVPDHPREKLQAEIKRQFGLVGRLETRDTDVLLLKVKKADASGLEVSDGTPIWKAVNPPHLSWPDIYAESITNFAANLESFLRMPVIDKTGLKGQYNISLSWSQQRESRSFRSFKEEQDALKKALLDEAGLELVPSRETIEMLVVEKVK